MDFARGHLVTFSGIDGTGKSTQIQLLGEQLKRCGKRPVYLWTRGGYTGPFNAMKTCLRRLLSKRLPPPGQNEERARAFKKPWIRTLWLSIAILDLLLLYGFYVRISRILGRVILADRYLWDTWVDFQLNFRQAKVDQWILWRILTRLTPEPDASFLLIIPTEESLRRSKQKNDPFPDSEYVLRKKKELYLCLASARKWHYLDGLKPIQSIHETILEKLSASA